jgi:hypothetical protein
MMYGRVLLAWQSLDVEEEVLERAEIRPAAPMAAWKPARLVIRHAALLSLSLSLSLVFSFLFSLRGRLSIGSLISDSADSMPPERYD